jgi:hypothetical protein
MSGDLKCSRCGYTIEQSKATITTDITKNGIKCDVYLCMSCSVKNKEYNCCCCGSVFKSMDNLIITAPAITEAGKSSIMISSNGNDYHCVPCINSILKNYVKTLP